MRWEEIEWRIAYGLMVLLVAAGLGYISWMDHQWIFGPCASFGDGLKPPRCWEKK